MFHLFNSVVLLHNIRDCGILAYHLSDCKVIDFRSEKVAAEYKIDPALLFQTEVGFDNLIGENKSYSDILDLFDKLSDYNNPIVLLTEPEIFNEIFSTFVLFTFPKMSTDLFNTLYKTAKADLIGKSLFRRKHESISFKDIFDFGSTPKILKVKQNNSLREKILSGLSVQYYITDILLGAKNKEIYTDKLKKIVYNYIITILYQGLQKKYLSPITTLNLTIDDLDNLPKTLKKEYLKDFGTIKDFEYLDNSGIEDISNALTTCYPDLDHSEHFMLELFNKIFNETFIYDFVDSVEESLNSGRKLSFLNYWDNNGFSSSNLLKIIYLLKNDERLNLLEF